MVDMEVAYIEEEKKAVGAFFRISG